ncbi:MAG: carboxypeptidase-like regulatory domain-containing protein [Bacteroidales bacterium]|nr:carboxypeptidase-like regulatory domain-containing protein [Bacteroidales bacterium]
MKQIVLTVFIILSLTISAVSGDGNGANSKIAEKLVSSISVSGFVEDLTNNEKLVCAKIEIEELDKTLFTDILGNYCIENIEPGTYTFKVSYISYEELELKQITIGSQKELNIQLKPL